MANNNPVPINDSSRCKTCGEIISSDCVAWAGSGINGVTICKGANLTDVITNVGTAAINITASCYTGNWIDFSASIPISGNNSGGVNWTIGSFGTPFGGSGSITGTENNPEYKWTKEGDLKIRGSFFFGVNPVPPITNVFIQIPLFTIPIGCFNANNGAKSQTSLVSTDSFASGNAIIIGTRGHLTINPLTGVLYFNFSYAQPTPSSFSVQVFLGAVTFNLS